LVKELMLSCDVIIHNGANINMGLPMGQLENCNIDGVRTTLLLARMCHLRVVHISSLSVFNSRDYCGNHKICYPNPRHLEVDYARSKWLGEQCALKASDAGLQVHIVRPGIIKCESTTGMCNPTDVSSLTMIGCSTTKCAPDLDIYSEMTQVDDVAREVCDVVLGESRSFCTHAVSREILSLRESIEVLNDNGHDIKFVPFDEWQSNMKATFGTGVDELFSALTVHHMDGHHFLCESNMKHTGGSGKDSLIRMLKTLKLF